jgi:hypothetical protein
MGVRSCRPALITITSERAIGYGYHLQMYASRATYQNNSQDDGSWKRVLSGRSGLAVVVTLTGTRLPLHRWAGDIAVGNVPFARSSQLRTRSA